MKMKIAASIRMIPGETFREKLYTAAEMGFEGLEIRIPEEEAVEENIREAEKALAETGLTACALLVPGAAFARVLDSREALEAKKAHAMGALRLSARLQTPVLLTPEYRSQDPLPLFDVRRPDAEEQKLLTEFLAFASDYAGRVGTKCFMEPVNRYESHFFHTLGEAAAAIDEAGAENVLILADLFHMHFEERDPAEALRKYASRIGHVQIGDSNRLLPGQGHTDFRPDFAALRECGYEGCVALECGVEGDPAAELPACIRRLRRLMEEQ